MFVDLSKSLKSDSLKRWIEKAEVTDCLHKLTLDIDIDSIWALFTPQDTAVLEGYKQDHQVERETRFGSVSGRNWTATCSDDVRGIGSARMTFKVNH